MDAADIQGYGGQSKGILGFPRLYVADIQGYEGHTRGNLGVS